MQHLRPVRLLTFASAVFLAWSLFSMLGPQGSPSTKGRTTLAIRCLPRAAAHPDALGAQVTVWYLSVDGRRLHWHELDLEGAWETRPFGTHTELFRTDDTQPASLAASGRFLLANFFRTRSSGRIQLERGGLPVGVEDLYATEGGVDTVVVEVPPRPPPRWTFWGFLVLCLALAAWLGPRDAEKGAARWLLLYLSILHLAVWLSQRVHVGPDSVGYLNQARAHLRDGIPGYFLPGYPAFLALLDRLPAGGLGGTVTLVQHGMTVIAFGWIYRFLRRSMPGIAAYGAALVAGTSTPALAGSQMAMSECLAFFGMTGALQFTSRACETGSRLRAGVAGLFAGWAALTRAVPLAASLPSSLFLFRLRRPRPFRSHVAFFLLGALFPIGGILLWHGVRSGRWRMSHSLGMHLFNRVVTSQEQLDEEGTATKTLLFLFGGKDPRGRPHWEIGGEERLLRRVAWEGIRKDPLAYLAFTFRQGWRQYHADPCPDLSPWEFLPPRQPELETPPWFGPTRSSLAWRRAMDRAYAVIHPASAWLGLAGIVLCALLARFRPLLAMGWIPVGYLLATASVEFFLPRYNAAISPFVTAIAFVPVAWVASLASRALRRLRPAASS